MKNLKKYGVILLALALLLSLATIALAAEGTEGPEGDPEVSADGSEPVAGGGLEGSKPEEPQKGYVSFDADYKEHTMVAYQIFLGSQLKDDTTTEDSPDGDETEADENYLGVTGWGPGVEAEALLAVLTGDGVLDGAFAGCVDAIDVAEVLNEKVDDGEFAKKFASFLHDNKDTVLNESKELDVSKENELDVGYWVILDETDPETLDGLGADSRAISSVLLRVIGNGRHDIATKVDVPTVDKKVEGQGAIVGSIGQVVNFTITATLPSNYADYDTYKMEFTDKMAPGLEFNKDSFKIKYGNGGTAVPLDEKMIVFWEYSSKDGSRFVLEIKNLKEVAPDLSYDNENMNTVILTYSATINEDAVTKVDNKVVLNYSNDPNWSDDPKSPTDPTPEETATVIVLDLTVEKVDGSTMEGLGGAGFTLYIKNEDNEWTKYGKEGSEYVKTVEPVEFTDEEGNTKTKYTLNFGQLGLGSYRLVETTVPAGYNKAEDLVFNVDAIKATEDDVKKDTTCKLKVGDVIGVKVVDDEGNLIEGLNPTVDTSEDETEVTYNYHLNTVVENFKGRTLPETGGIGTTIFYIVGGVLVIVAGVLLVTKKRMSKMDR